MRAGAFWKPRELPSSSQTPGSEDPARPWGEPLLGPLAGLLGPHNPHPVEQGLLSIPGSVEVGRAGLFAQLSLGLQDNACEGTFARPSLWVMWKSNGSNLPGHLVLAPLARTSQRSSQTPEQGWGQGWMCLLCLGPGQDFPRVLEGFLPPVPERGRQGRAAVAQAGMWKPIHYQCYYIWTVHLLL